MTKELDELLTTKGRMMEEQLLEIIKEESEKADVRQFTCVNGFGYSQFERNLAKSISNRLEKLVRQGDFQPMLLAEELEDMELEAKAELIVDNDLRYGDDDKAVYWELQANTSDEIEAEKCLELLAKNWKVGTKIFVFVPEDSKQSA